MKTQSYKKGLAFVLTLAMVFTTLFGGFGFLGINGIVDEVYAATIASTLDLTAMPSQDNISTDGWAWDSSTSTLTLSGINLSTASPCGIIVPSGASIVVDGVNNVESVYVGDNAVAYGIQATGNLAITGVGTLTVTGGATTWGNSAGIYSPSGKITITGGALTLNAFGVSADAQSYGIRGFRVEINSGNINASGGAASNISYGIEGDVVINGGTVNAVGGNGDNASYGIFTDSLKIYGGSVTASTSANGTNNYGIRAGYMATISGINTRVESTGKTAGISIARSLSVESGAQVTASGIHSMNTTQSIGLQAGALMIKDNNTIVTANGDDVLTAGGVSYGFKCVDNWSGPLVSTISGGTLNANGGDATVSSHGIYMGDLSTLVINGGNINATAGTASNRVAVSANAAANAITLGASMSVTSPIGGGLSSDGKFIATGSGGATAATSVAIAYSDTTPPTSPTVSGTTPTSDATPTWTWTAGGGGNGTFRYKLDSLDLTTGATTAAVTSFTPVASLSEGAHTLYVQERDAAGNWSSSGSRAIVIDTTAPTAPTVTGTTPTSDTTPTWSWTAGSGGNGTFRYKLDSSDLTTGATTAAITSFTSGVLSAGPHTLYVQESDAAGNWSASGSFAIVIDTTQPTAGSGGTITLGAITSSTVNLIWTAGTDNLTVPANLQYKVVYSTSNNIDTVSNATSNGAIALNWTANTTSHNVTGLTASTNYYFNVIIRDEAGNMAVYTTTSTATTAQTNGSGDNGGSGGGGGSTPATPIINTNTGSVTGNQLKNAADVAKDGGTVTIKSDKTNEVTLPNSGLNSLTGKNNSLTVVTENGTLTFDSKSVAAIGTQATATDIKVIVDDVVKTTLTEEQQTKVGDKTIYDLTVMSGGKLISSFNGGKVNVSIPYELKAGETAENVTVWYMADNGSLTEINCTYDAKNKAVTFVVDHFSKYIIGYDGLAGWANPFTDVKSSAWYYDAVAFVNGNGLMNGQTGTAFGPQTAMTRGMFVTILGRMEGIDTTLYASKNTFSDVKSNQYYAPFIAWATDKGIVSGMGGDKFAPNAAVTREQMAVMMMNYMKLKGQGPTGEWAIQLTYSDLDQVSSWADEAVMFMTMKDLMNGTGNDATGNPLFAPKSTSTRAQTAQVMMSLGELVK